MKFIFERVCTCRLNIKTICASVKNGKCNQQQHSSADKTYFARNNNFYDDDDTYVSLKIAKAYRKRYFNEFESEKLKYDMKKVITKSLAHRVRLFVVPHI